MKMKIIKNRIYHPVPAPWRPRLSMVTQLFNDIQSQLEVGIGWKKEYDKYFTCNIEELTDQEVDILIYALKTLNYDMITVEHMDSFLGGIYRKTMRGLIQGKSPRFKRRLINP